MGTPFKKAFPYYPGATLKQRPFFLFPFTWGCKRTVLGFPKPPYLHYITRRVLLPNIFSFYLS